MGLETGQDLANYCLARGGEATDTTSKFQGQMANIMAERFRKLYMEYDYLDLMAYPPASIITFPAIKTLLLTTTVGLQAASLNAAPTGLGGGNVSILNFWILPGAKTYFFRVAAHASGSVNVTLDVAAPETLTAVACTIAQMEYSLPATVGVLADQAWTDGGGSDGERTDIVTEEELRRAYPDRPAGPEWPPNLAARITRTLLRLSCWDTTAHRMEIPYYQEPADPSPTDNIVTNFLPDYLKPMLVEGMLAVLYELKGDQRRALADARYTEWRSLVQDYEMRLRTGRGVLSNRRRNEPYGDNAQEAPYG